MAINNDAPERGSFRTWVTNLATGETDEQVGAPYGSPFDFRHPDDQEPSEPHAEMSFVFLGGIGPPGIASESTRLYAWATMTDAGRVVAWDYAPDLAWLARPPGTGLEPLPTASPESRGTATRTDSEIAAILSGLVDSVYCGDVQRYEPNPEWCSRLGRTGGNYAIEVHGTSVFISASPADSTDDRRLATTMCGPLAAIHFDRNGEDLGVRHFHILDASGSNVIGVCDIPVL
jgi:hypothetical protein